MLGQGGRWGLGVGSISRRRRRELVRFPQSRPALKRPAIKCANAGLSGTDEVRDTLVHRSKLQGI